ncbi:GntR family transcriptional regulator [Chloroflexota bacterium]
MTVTLSDQAYEIIKAEILTCALEPGQQIAQSEIAGRHNLRTTPVREALQRLVTEGFVEAIPRFGYVVSPITLSDVHEIFEMRCVLEVAAARMAAVRGTEAQMEELSSAAEFTYVYRDRTSYSEFLAQNSDFHHSISVLASNTRLASQISSVLDELTRLFHLGLDLRDSAGEMRDEHIALAAALIQRDPDQAERVVQSQIARSKLRVMEALTQRQGSDPLASLQQAVQVQLRPPG